MKKVLFGIIVLSLTLSAFAENKYALLIANSKYKNFSSLDGPVKEARDLSIALKSLGFTVELLENGTREQMIDELDSIKQKISGKGGVALFHYGGHGVQAQGRNFLIPVDADVPDEKKLSTRAVDIDEVMSSLDSCGSDTNIVILDACRNNPLPAGSGRSASRGLTVVGVKPKNSIIVYSAEAGTVAQDGLFTPTLTRLITQNGKSLNQILMQLRREVNQKSNGAQIPGEYNQLFDDVFLDSATNIASVPDPVKAKGSISANSSFEHIGNLKAKTEVVVQPLRETINGIAADWYIFNGNYKLKTSIVTDRKTGKYAQKIEITEMTAADPSKPWGTYVSLRQKQTVLQMKPNTKYRYSVWVKGKGVASFIVAFNDYKNVILSQQPFMLTNKWELVEYSFTTPDSVTEISEMLRFDDFENFGASARVGDYIIIDDFNVFEE